jgi:hypothetical protein
MRGAPVAAGAPTARLNAKSHFLLDRTLVVRKSRNDGGTGFELEGDYVIDPGHRKSPTGRWLRRRGSPAVLDQQRHRAFPQVVDQETTVQIVATTQVLLK